jgi:hypothetical protein
MEIVYTYTGKLPSYIVGAVHQSRTWSNNKITIITDDIDSQYLPILKKYDVSVINAKELEDQEFLKTIELNKKKFCIAEKLEERKFLFIRSFERFFLLHNYMKKYSCENVLFLELDVLLYFNPDEILPILSQKDVTVSYVTKDFYCSGLFYVKSTKILNSITEYFKEFIENAKSDQFVSEMHALGEWTKKPENTNRIWFLPSIGQDERYDSLTYKDFDSFNKTLFDGAGIAIAVDGPDYTHRSEWIEKEKLWWGTEVKYNQFSYNWKTENGLRVLYAKPDTPGAEDYKVQCLHIHRKYLHGFLSKPLQFINPEDSPFIHGDRFLKIAEVVLRKKSRTDYYEVQGWDMKNCVYFEDIPEIPGVWNNPKLIFMNTEDVEEFMKHLYKLRKPFILLTHNSDTNVTDRFLPLCEHPNLIHWFTQNLCMEHRLVSPLPIGFANPIWPHGNQSLFSQIKQVDPSKTYPIYANFLIETNRKAREDCLSNLEKKGIPFLQKRPPPHYLYELATSYSCVCPEGNGIDTHRFWEALFLGTVPIVLRNPLTERLAKEFPCLVLDTWEDLPINPQDNEKMKQCLDWIRSNNPSYIEKTHFSYYNSQILSTYLNS